MKSGRPASGVRCNEVQAKKFTAARMCRFLSTKWRAVKSGEQKFTAKTPLRGGAESSDFTAAANVPSSNMPLG